MDQNKSDPSAIMAYRGQIIDDTSSSKAPTGAWDPEVVRGILDQINLNSGESVLLYSGVLQAVPLVGAAFKFTSILNRAARKLSKSFRRKPFTTVVKSLIALDFVDRFVISPTIDDARKFMDATNYVLRKLETARERSTHVFALESGVKTVLEKSEVTRYMYQGGYSGTIRVRQTTERYIEDKAFALCEGTYDMTGDAPLKLWAHRVGLTRPLDSAWDLVPFSFVIDYFTRAGDFISALSDEMSSVNGLSGSMVKIRDLWGTHRTVARVISEPLQWTSEPSLFWNDNRIAGPSFTDDPVVTYESGTFDRFRITNQWSVLSSLQRKVSDYISVTLNPSSKQKRTIAELIIQAKL
jgi:hypothetical protein